MSEHTVEQVVRQLLQDVLSVEPHELTPQAGFFTDLGGESIDWIDFIFRCEKHWGVRIDPQGINASLPGDVDAEGRLTEAGVRRVRERFAFVDVKALGERPSVVRVRDELTTVQSIIAFVRHAIDPSGALRSQ